MHSSKKIVAFTVGIFLLIISYPISSQTKAKDFGFSTSFDNTGKKRYIYSSTEFNTKAENGTLHLAHSLEGKSYYISEFSYLDYKADFTISSNFKLQNGNKLSCYGILFGANGISNSYIFIINDFGQYHLFKYKNDKMETIKEWAYTDNLKQKGEVNTIDIKCEKGSFNFYINSKLTYTCPALPSFGFDVGYYVSGVTSITSDYFSIFQKQNNPINLIDNANSFGKKTNLGQEINSKADEFSPIITSDEKTLYIARKANEVDYNNTADEDIWYAEYSVKDSAWHHMKNIGKPLNNKANNFIQAVSADNNQIITGNLYDSKGEYKGLGFSISHRTKTGWSIPKDLKIKDYYNLHKYNEICLSPDGHVMMLAIQRDDTYGSKDLYVSFMQSDSSWSAPKNIGKTINTFADETSPFIAADGVTMYFATAGHPGYGDNDIFLTKRLDETWLNWSKPKNLGPIINADTWDSYYTVPASGKNAYLVTTVNNNSDIYIIKQPESAKPNPVVLIKGYVFNSETKQPIDASIHYSELGSKKILGHFKSDPKTGLFTLSLPKGKKYSFVADKTDFISIHENIDLVNLKNYSEQELDLYITPIKKGQSVVINNLFFTANKAEILPESYPELDKIIDVLKNNPRMKILVSGHTSKNNSTAEWNMNLSTNRALSVKNYFIQHGIAENRVQHIGYGSDKPINKLPGEANLAKNRRVEFEILEH